MESLDSSPRAQTLRFRDNLDTSLTATAVTGGSGGRLPEAGRARPGAGASKRVLFYITLSGAAINPDAEDNRGIPNAAKFTKEYILSS